MNVREAINSLRDDYIQQFDAMVEHQRAKRTHAYLDRRIERPESDLFGKVYVPDVSFGDPLNEWLDLVPRQRITPSPGFSLKTPDLVVDFEDLWWDDFRLDHDGEFTGQLVSWWFDRWMPPVDLTKPRAEALSGFIHSATVDDKWICADLGTATVEALFSLLSIAQRCGAKHALVTSTRNRPTAQPATEEDA